jgi:hypothetical protein
VVVPYHLFTLTLPWQRDCTLIGWIDENVLNNIRSRGDEALFVCIFYLRYHIFVMFVLGISSCRSPSGCLRSCRGDRHPAYHEGTVGGGNARWKRGSRCRMSARLHERAHAFDEHGSDSSTGVRPLVVPPDRMLRLLSVRSPLHWECISRRYKDSMAPWPPQMFSQRISTNHRSGQFCLQNGEFRRKVTSLHACILRQ